MTQGTFAATAERWSVQYLIQKNLAKMMLQYHDRGWTDPLLPGCQRRSLSDSVRTSSAGVE
jgi:hypothetical protein